MIRWSCSTSRTPFRSIFSFLTNYTVTINKSYFIKKSSIVTSKGLISAIIPKTRIKATQKRNQADFFAPLQIPEMVTTP